jgi:hypothetical protein
MTSSLKTPKDIHDFSLPALVELRSARERSVSFTTSCTQVYCTVMQTRGKQLLNIRYPCLVESLDKRSVISIWKHFSEPLQVCNDLIRICPEEMRCMSTTNRKQLLFNKPVTIRQDERFWWKFCEKIYVESTGALNMIWCLLLSICTVIFWLLLIREEEVHTRCTRSRSFWSTTENSYEKHGIEAPTQSHG